MEKSRRRPSYLDSIQEVGRSIDVSSTKKFEVGPGWEKLLGLDETRRDSIGRFSISLTQRLVLHQSSKVSISLVGGRSLPDGGDVASLAYWVTGTEGSNPSLSATQSSKETRLHLSSGYV
jgi:hypothetical protein